MNRRFDLPALCFAFSLLLLTCAARQGVTAKQSSSPQSTQSATRKIVPASRQSKLPSPDRVISDHVKRIGGRKRLHLIRDAVYEWDVADAKGTARVQTKSDGALRLDLMPVDPPGAPTITTVAASTNGDRGSASTVFAATERLAWTRGADGETRTLVDKRSTAARLCAALLADRTFDYKRARALARTVARDEALAAHGEAAHVVEFTARDNTRVRAWFGTESRRLLRLSDEANSHAIDFYDYRVPASGGVQIMEPHRVTIASIKNETIDANTTPLVLNLHAARYNSALAASVFDAPPAADVSLDALLRDVTRRQRRADSSFKDYTYRVRRSEATLGKGGVVSKESSTTWEYYQIDNGYGAAKRVLVDDRPLAPAEAAKEDAQLVAALERMEKQPPIVVPPPSDKQKDEERPSGGFAITIGDFSLRLTDIMRISEFVSPRRETLRERESIVFDFQPRANFRPKNREEEIINKLRGVIWIDASDKLVSRFEAQLTEGFKIGGGLLASIRPGAAIVYEGQRLPEGLWMPRFYQLNANGRALFFSEINVLETTEWSDFKRFRTSTDAGIIAAPTDTPEPQP